jgi:hypothetical protein
VLLVLKLLVLNSLVQWMNCFFGVPYSMCSGQNSLCSCILFASCFYFFSPEHLQKRRPIEPRQHHGGLGFREYVDALEKERYKIQMLISA